MQGETSTLEGAEPRRSLARGVMPVATARPPAGGDANSSGDEGSGGRVGFAVAAAAAEAGQGGPLHREHAAVVIQSKWRAKDGRAAFEAEAAKQVRLFPDTVLRKLNRLKAQHDGFARLLAYLVFMIVFLVITVQRRNAAEHRSLLVPISSRIAGVQFFDDDGDALTSDVSRSRTTDTRSPSQPLGRRPYAAPAACARARPWGRLGGGRSRDAQCALRRARVPQVQLPRARRTAPQHVSCAPSANCVACRTCARVLAQGAAGGSVADAHALSALPLPPAAD